MSLFPGAIASFIGFTATHTLAADSHAAQHNSEQAEIIAVETKVGTGSSTPSSGTVLRGTGAGASAWGQVALSTDITGTMPVANGGTGQNSLTGVPLASPVISGGGSWAGSPVLGTPTVADFTNAQHTHQNAAGGGQLVASSALTSGSITASRIGTDASFAFIDYSATSTIIGWASFTTKVIKYFQIGKLCFVIFDLEGTSNSTSSSFTLPLTQQGTPAFINSAMGLAVDNGAATANMGRLELASNVVSLFLTNAGTGWTGSGTKKILGQFFFEVA